MVESQNMQDISRNLCIYVIMYHIMQIILKFAEEKQYLTASINCWYSTHLNKI